MRMSCGVSTVKRAFPTTTTAFGSATGLSAAGIVAELLLTVAAEPLC